MNRWRFPPTSPQPQPCVPHKVLGDCGICRLQESLVAALIASWRRS